MTTRPRIICLMTGSVDGRLHLSRWTESPDGALEDWSPIFERIHDEAGADGWIVGRATMAEMAKGEPHPPTGFTPPPRPHHFARREGPFAVAIDRSGKLHFAEPEIGGDHLVVLLGPDVPDNHLAELVGDGVSYVVSGDAGMAFAPMLETLAAELGVSTLMLEGGGHANGSFLEQGLVDELVVIVTPTLDGSRTSPAIVEAGEGLKGKVTLSLKSCEPMGHGAVQLRYTVAKPAA